MKTMTSNMDTTTMDTTWTMKKGFNLGLAAFVAASIMLCSYEAWAGATQARNPPECDKNSEDCGCDNGEEVTPACIKVNLALGETTPWTRSMSCALKIFADSDSPNVFSQDSLYAVLGGYTFKRLGTKNLSDGVTPAEVVLAHPQGEPVHFVFKDGESMAQPDPGVHIKMDERLQMVDAEGWATTHDPVYYDLYVGDGSRRRFLATDMTGALGSLVSITDARGVTVTPADMGVNIIYDANGVRQFLTPSRLADVIPLQGFKGFEVKVYALQAAPQKNAATGLYVPPQATPVKHLQVRPENGWRRAIVTLKSGGSDPRRYVFDYALGDWSMTRSSGVEERKEREVADGRAAYIKNETIAADGTLLSRKVKNYSHESWGFAMTNRVEGFDGVTNVTEWTYYTSGNGKGQVKTEKRQSGLLIQYAYDNVDRIISETRSGPDMMTEMTTYDYTPVDPSDPILPVDTRPRTVVRKLNNIECERTYYVYSPFTNIVERVGTQGAAFGGTNVLRTVTAFYPIVANDLRSGLVASVRHEDGKLDVYDYALTSNLWVETVTHLHEQSPSPVSGKTTRDITLTNARGENIEQKTEAFIDGIWYTITRNRMTYNEQGKRTSVENLAGQITTTAWDCCHKVSEVQPDGSTTTWDYDDEGRVIASSRLIPLDMTNVTWLTTCYRYDGLGRQTATWQTNLAAQVGLPVTRTRYDQLGRVIARVDTLGNTTTTEYSPDGRTVFVRNPNTSTRVVTRSPNGDVLSITGTAVTPEFHTYGILPDGIRWSRTVQGETANSPRFTKRYENLLGQTIREERSGFQDAVLATTHAYDSLGRLVSTSADYEPTTEYTYDTLGNRIATTRRVGAAATGTTSILLVDAEWRKTETLTSFVLEDAIVWLTQTNVVSCSDSAIAPLVSSSARQLIGLTPALPSRSRSTDIRGNVTENEVHVTVPVVTSSQIVPYATNRPLTVSRYGVGLQVVSVSAVTNTVAYDFLGRKISQTDGRGNTRHTEYNSLGQRSVSIDALGNRTIYAYDQFGNLASVTDPLGHVIVYEYDLRGNMVLEYGATYPVRYTYDIFGNKITMTTFREGFVPDASVSGDTTIWLYDETSGAMTNKVYADGKGPTYSYTPDGKLSQRIWARGITTDYSYDGWGNLTNTFYSDGTPSVTLAYDAMGRQTNAVDVAGVATFTYDSFGSQTGEIINGLYAKNIVRHYDLFGRADGYTSEGIRRTRIAYDSATGRISGFKSGGVWFDNRYLAGTDLRDRIKYGNSGYAYYSYETNRDVLAQVRNEFGGNTISQYDYVCDAIGSRVQIARSGTMMSESRNDAYGYNERNELISASKSGGSQSTATEYSYKYDDIGNRITSTELDAGGPTFVSASYAANNLNQYTSISNSATSAFSAGEFSPAYDADGNQTLVQTSTGIWQVQYNGENRPVLWSNGATNITMKFDRMGRRVEYIETVATDAGGSQSLAIETNTHHRFVYDEYLCIQRLNAAADNAIDLIFAWDPAERVATRPLMIEKLNVCTLHVTHDGNKNVSDLVFFSGGSGVAAHYEYAPFGAVTASTRNSASTAYDFRTYNSFRFSSEYADDSLGLVYYNYRHYEPVMGRGVSRDRAAEFGYANLYVLSRNSPCGYYDILGLADCCECGKCQIQIIAKGPFSLKGIRVVTGLGEIVSQLDKDLFWDKAKGKIKDKVLEKAFKDAYDIVEKAKANAGLLENLANVYSTLGHQFQPQCQYMSVVDIKRRDCVKRFFSKKCRWSKWEARKETIYSDWITPEQFKDTQTGQENWVAILDDPNPADVIDQMKKLMEKIKQNAQSELDKIDVATALSKQTGCEVVADLFAETEE